MNNIKKCIFYGLAVCAIAVICACNIDSQDKRIFGIKQTLCSCKVN